MSKRCVSNAPQPISQLFYNFCCFYDLDNVSRPHFLNGNHENVSNNCTIIHLHFRIHCYQKHCPFRGHYNNNDQWLILTSFHPLEMDTLVLTYKSLMGLNDSCMNFTSFPIRCYTLFQNLGPCILLEPH